MGSLLRWLSLRHWLEHPARAGLTLVGVALGVAVTVAVDLIGNEILHSHRRALEAIAGKAQLTVTAGESGMPRAVVEEIYNFAGIAYTEPLLEQMLIEPGKGPVLLLGVDLLGDDTLRQVEGAGENDEDILDDPLAFLNSTTSVMVSETFANRRGLKKGDGFELSTTKGKKPFVIRGLIKDKGPAKAMGGDVVVMYLDAAQVALGLDDVISRVDLAVKEGVNPDTVLDSLQRHLDTKLGPGYTVELPMRRGARMEEMMSGLQQALYMMAALSIWVGILLAYNAVEISVRQRKNELAIIRALGAERRHLIAMVLIEAVILGAVATVVGIVLGWLMGKGGVQSTAASVSSIYEVVKVNEVQLTFRSVIAGIGVGLVMPVLGALRPARWIANQEVSTALSRSVEEVGTSKGERWSMIIGAVLLATGVGMFLSPQAQENVFVGYSAFGVVLLGAVFLAPPVIAGVAMLIHRLLGDRLDAETIVAIDHVVRDRRRAALNVASLVAGVATVLTVGTYIHSLVVTNDRWLENAVPADLFVTSGSKLAMTQNTPLDPSFALELAALPGVKDVLNVRLADIDYEGIPVKLVTVELEPYLPRTNPIVLSGRIDTAALVAGKEILVSEPVQRRWDKGPGDVVTLQTPSGPRDFIVGAVIVDFASDKGVFIIDRAIYVDLYKDPLVDSFDVFLHPGVEPLPLQEKIRGTWGESKNLFVLTNREFKDEARKLIESFFALLDLLQLVTLLIAVLGVSTTLIAAVLDRTQEVGVMRAVGSRPVQIVRIVLTEAAFLGSTSMIFGAALGSLTGFLFLKSILVASVGWSLPYVPPVDLYPGAFLAVVGSSLLAALYPAIWSAKQPPLDAIRAE